MLKKKEKLSKKLNKNVLKLKKKSLKKEKLSKKYRKRFLDFKRALFQKSAQDWYRVLAISEKKKLGQNIMFTFVLVCLLEQFGLIHFKRN